jgi:hypothetical protein
MVMPPFRNASSRRRCEDVSEHGRLEDAGVGLEGDLGAAPLVVPVFSGPIGVPRS